MITLKLAMTLGKSAVILFTFWVLKKLQKSEFELLQKLDLLTVVDEYNYHHKLLSNHGEHKFDEYFKNFNESKEQRNLEAV